MRGIDGVDVHVGTSDITLYRDDLLKGCDSGRLAVRDISFAWTAWNLVLVDGRVSTGRTIRAAMNGLFLTFGRPKRGVSRCRTDRSRPPGKKCPIEALRPPHVQTSGNFFFLEEINRAFD